MAPVWEGNRRIPLQALFFLMEMSTFWMDYSGNKQIFRRKIRLTSKVDPQSF